MFQNMNQSEMVSAIASLQKMQKYCLNNGDRENLEKVENALYAELKDRGANLSLSGGKYTIAPTYLLRDVCMENNLFTCASNDQYERFFVMNQNKADFNLLVSYAYACSDITSIDIVRDILNDARTNYNKTHKEDDDKAKDEEDLER